MTSNSTEEYRLGYEAGKAGKNFGQASAGIKKKESIAAFTKGFIEGQAARARGER